MTVIARDAVASDHLVYAWPFPIGPECEVSCADDEQVVMCPAWTVGDRLGPGRHLWRTPDPSRPVSAFFVLTAPVEASFDLTTMFVVPMTGQPVRLRAAGGLQVRCLDPGLLVAQFVGLPFGSVNDGILRSVSRSIERMLARLLTRRVVMAASPIAVTDPGMMAGIIEELIAYNPTAGAVFGIELMRISQLAIAADDGSSPQLVLAGHSPDWGNSHGANGEALGSQPGLARSSQPDIPLPEARGRAASHSDATLPPPMGKQTVRGHVSASTSELTSSASGEIVVKPKPDSTGVPVEIPRSTDDITQPGVKSPTPPPRASSPVAASLAAATPAPASPAAQPAGSILGIGVSHIGHVVAGEIPSKVAPGARVLVPGPNGLMQSATVRQLLQGYYELEVGSSGETIWVPINGVVPE